MKREYIKYVFLLSFLSIAGKCLIEGWDIASGFAMLVVGALIYGYEFVDFDKRFKELEKEIATIKEIHEDTLKKIQGVASAQNAQAAKPASIMGKAGIFPPRMS